MIKKTPRYYQSDAKKSMYRSWKQKLVPYASICTGGGKSLIAADITEDVLKQDKRIIQLVSTKKLCQQNYNEAFGFVTNKQALGQVCLKLGKRQNHRQAVIAMMKSFYSMRATSGAFDVCLIDECDLVSPDENTQYRKIIKSLLRLNPNMHIGGLTASPYRDDQGELFNQCKKGTPLFTNQCYETPIVRMMEEGYLSNIIDISGDVHIDLDGVKTIRGDYSSEQVGVKFDAILDDAVIDMRYKFEEFNIKTSVIFASTVKNAYHILNAWNDNSTMRVSHGGLSEKELDDNLKWLEFGKGSRYLVNVGLYIRGFDYQQLQCVCLFLATKVVSKYVQIIGRVLRAHDDKPFAHVWDCGTNIARLGPIDNLTPPAKKTRVGDAPRKACIAIVEETKEFEGLVYRRGDVCNYPNLLSARKCKVCGAEFVSDSETGLYTMRTRGEILKAKIDAETYTYEVARVTFEKAYSKKDQTEMIKLNFIDESGLIFHNYYLCLNHQGYARHKCITHLLQMMKAPENYPLIASANGGVNVENVLLLFNNAYDKYFKRFKTIKLAPNGKFKELKNWEFVQ
jgi:DNA repair protein RadD